MEKFLNVKEVAEMLNCAVSSIHRHIAVNGLPVLKIGFHKKLLFSETEVKRWLYKKTREAKRGKEWKVK